MTFETIVSRRSFYIAALAAAALSSVAVFEACSKKANPDTACKLDADCPAGDVCTASVCTKAVICACTARQECVISTGACIELGCRTNADCSSGQNCVASVCQTPVTAAASCEVLNSSRYVAQGGSLTIQAEGFDASNAPVPYLTLTSVAVDHTDVFSTDGTSTITAGTTTGTASVTATIGGVTCNATFTNIGTALPGTLRVTAIEAGADGAFISGLAPAGTHTSLFRVSGPDGAFITDSFSEGTPGTYTATIPPSSPTLVVQFIGSGDFAPLTVYGTPSSDLELPLSRISGVAGFGGKPDFTNYKQNPPITSGEIISAAIVGASLPPSILLSFDLSLFTGDLGLEPPLKSGQQAVALQDYITWLTGPDKCAIAQDAATTTPVSGQLPIPRYIYLDYNQGTAVDKGPNCDGFAARGLQGHRVAWSLGAELDFVTLSSAIFPVFQGGTSGLSVGTILPLVVPLLSSFSAGANPLKHDVLVEQAPSLWNAFAIPSAPGTQSSDTNFDSINVTPTLPLGNIALFQDPGLPADPAEPATKKFDTVATVIAAQSPAFGLVPLGLGFGTDADGDGKLDSLNVKDLAHYPADVVYTRYASPGAPVSDASIVVIAGSLNLKDLSAKAGSQISPALRIQLNVSRKPGALGWTDSSSPTLPSMTDTTINAPFITMKNDAAYSVSTATEATGGYDTLILPVMGTSGDVSQDGLVYVNVTGGVTTSGVTSYGVVVNPAQFNGSNPALAIPIKIGYLPTSNLPSLTVTAVSLKFDNNNGISALNANGGLDFEQLAASMNAVSIWSQTIPLSTAGRR